MRLGRPALVEHGSQARHRTDQGALLLCSARLVSISAPHGLDGALLPIAPVRAPCCPRGRRSKAKTVATPGPASTGNRSTRERPTSAARCPALGPRQSIAVPAKARRFCFGVDRVLARRA